MIIKFSNYIKEDVQDTFPIKTKYNIKPKYNTTEEGIPAVQDTMGYPTEQSKEMEQDELNFLIFKLSPYYKYVRKTVTNKLTAIGYERDEEEGSGFSWKLGDNKYYIFYNKDKNRIVFQTEEDGGIFAMPLKSPWDIKNMI